MKKKIYILVYAWSTSILNKDYHNSVVLLASPNMDVLKKELKKKAEKFIDEDLMDEVNDVYESYGLMNSYEHDNLNIVSNDAETFKKIVYNDKIAKFTYKFYITDIDYIEK